MNYDKNNIFAKIIRGEAPCGKIAESEYSIAFNDLHPQAKTHILVIPKGPYGNILDFAENASSAEQADFWNLVRKIADDAGIAARFRIVINTGAPAQSVFHFHAHLLAD